MLTISLAASALAGFCAKVADELAERGLGWRKKAHGGAAGAGRGGASNALFFLLPLLLAAIYGAALGWLSATTILSSLFIALAIASLLAGKIDHPYHMLGAAIFALALLLFPPVVLDPWLFCLFLASALLDELELGGMTRGLAAFFNRERLWTPLACLGAFVALGAPLIYLLALIAFDAAYRFGGWLADFEFGTQKAANGSRKIWKKKKK